MAGGSKDDLVVLVGDAKFNPTFGGKNGSAGPMFKAILELRKLGFTVRGFPADFCPVVVLAHRVFACG